MRSENLHSSIVRQILEEKLDETCCSHARDEKCIQNFSQETWKETCVPGIGGK
jgi:hypothetical protein